MAEPPDNLVSYRFEDLELDVGRRQLLRGEDPLQLTKLTFKLLLALVQSAPDVAPHSDLAARVWGNQRIVTPETLAQRIRILRRCLGDSATRPRYIQGVRGHGYKLIPKVRALARPGPVPGTGLQDTPKERAAALFSQALALRNTNNHAPSAQLILKRAIEIDPGFAPAYALLAYIDHMAALVDTADPGTGVADFRDLVQRVRRNAEKARALSPDSGMAAAAMAGIDALSWHWTEARRGFDRASALGWASDLSPWFYCWSGDCETGVERARDDVGRRSGAAAAQRDLGITLAYAGRLDEAQTTLDRALELAPAEAVTRAWRVYVALRRDAASDVAKSLDELEPLLGAGRPIVFLPELAYCYGRRGDEHAARRIVDTITRVASEREVGAGTQAMASLAIGDQAAALRWLKLAASKAARHEAEPGMMNLMNLKMNFLDDPVLGEPAFASALSRIRGS